MFDFEVQYLMVHIVKMDLMPPDEQCILSVVVDCNGCVKTWNHAQCADSGAENNQQGVGRHLWQCEITCVCGLMTCL